MKKIKKAAVLVPAFATVVLATVGSVTGTMAWFTANRTATSTASLFEAAALNTSLVITTTAGTGTAQVDGKAQDISVSGKITHGSFDMGSEELSVAKYGSSDSIATDGTVTTNDKYTNISTLGKYSNSARTTNWKAGVDSGTNIWYAVTWTYKMEYTFAGNTNEHCLFIDLGSSVFGETAKVGDNIISGKTKNGLRIGLFNDNTKRIIGGDVTGESSTTPAAGVTYTGGYYILNDGAGASTNTKPSTDGKYLENLGKYSSTVDTSALSAPYYTSISSDFGEAADFQKEDQYTNRLDYLGKFPAAVGTTDKSSISFNVVAWFEGNDADIVNASLVAEYSSIVKASFKFYVNEIQPAQA